MEERKSGKIQRAKETIKGGAHQGKLRTGDTVAKTNYRAFEGSEAPKIRKKKENSNRAATWYTVGSCQVNGRNGSNCGQINFKYEP